MKYCTYCGNEVLNEAVICPSCGCQIMDIVIPEDKVSIGFCILSYLIPLFGIIYWACNYKKAPNKARACGACVIISILMPVIIIFMFGIFAGLAV